MTTNISSKIIVTVYSRHLYLKHFIVREQRGKTRPFRYCCCHSNCLHSLLSGQARWTLLIGQETEHTIPEKGGVNL